MKTMGIYESPQVEIVDIIPRDSVLVSSMGGEDIYDWEEM